MSKLDKSSLPFEAAASNNVLDDNSHVIGTHLDIEMLYEAAFQSFPDAWKDEAFEFVKQNSEFLNDHSLALPKSADSDPDFDATEILAMNMMCRLEVISEIKDVLSDHKNEIVSRLLEDATIRSRIECGEFLLPEGASIHLDSAA